MKLFQTQVVGREMLLHFAEELLYMYEFDDDITRLVDRTRIHILPSMNPDGFEDAVEGCTGLVGRYVRSWLHLARQSSYFRKRSHT